LPNQHRVPSPTTTAFEPRYGSFSTASNRDAFSLRSHGTDRDCPISKYSAATDPPNGSTNFHDLDAH
jgi:hypothetical protein